MHFNVVCIPSTQFLPFRSPILCGDLLSQCAAHMVSPYDYPPLRVNLCGPVSWASDYFGNGHMTQFVSEMLQETFASAFCEGALLHLLGEVPHDFLV